MADQKALKKRLKALMQRPENQVCADCPEKRPTWASLIVVPPGAPPGTEKLGCFCCLECSGSHRRLGVHIAFVRSINLDSWKEWEVRAMENGGNAKINAVFEAGLAESRRSKPSNLASGPTRERYIRDKYERRKFYDPAGFSLNAGSAAPAGANVQDAGGAAEPQVRPGAPSDIARRRVATRQAMMKPTKTKPTTSAAPTNRVAQAPVPAPAPADFDLLDFGPDTTTTPAPVPSATGGGDLFSSPPAPANPSSSGGIGIAIPPPPKNVPQAATPQTLAQELMNNSAPVESKTNNSNDDIMALFGQQKSPQNQQQSGFGMQAMNQMGPGGGVNANSATMRNQMMPRQQGNMMAFGNQPNMMNQQQQQQQQMMMMMQNNNNNMMQNRNQMMQQQMMMQRQMMMQQQQQQQMQMQNQFQINNAGAMNNMGMFNSTNGINNTMGRGINNGTNMNSAIQGMQNMTMGNTIATAQSNDDGGFGTPMGGNTQQQNTSNDAFSSLGGMNGFR
uniref:Arf-GAP domain-containing protein n=1 Tax=Pseudo-nitzschia australis TaxID=44445 RepID=A0A7S4EI93_9STRA|mmetsp:Transcript_14621/g.31145  ORF Transcript_14621/g.31145 Transcript_14621/m.31145 type:complete len:504 (-) Transcript_14621:101-1612(-)|eukprot:CAMPEP_0168190010 /NCGR_PEP_ID=MMETSP0139_2-20121125/16674_1 /TAXON_ID=44445 /ORGANISM="Pseudo-nitzschia australis, Strain 10249 10 AB" /LENGTH=503 /DNA_ID=CAMNT_0008112929 /DNA_START=86 /DNA_END=1600 /DNA_ORIENTATION=+